MIFNNLIKQQKVKLEEQLNLIEKTIQIREEHLGSINSQIKISEQNLEKILDKMTEYNGKITECRKELGVVEGYITMQEYGLEYNPNYNKLDKIVVEKARIQAKIAALIAENKTIITTREYRIDNSASKGNKFQKTYCENLIVGFTAYFNKKKKSVTKANVKETESFIRKKFSVFNKKGEILAVSINEKYLDFCIELMYLELDEKIAKAEERERIREERRRLKEEQQLLAEAEKERKKLEEERHNLQKLFAKAITKQEQEEIREKLAEVDKRTEEIDWRISHYSAGWLYITTTPAMPGIYKAGCTRQLNPLNRLAQLSSASVPFPFECRALVFSEDVFALEAKLHNRLNDKRVNKENKLKEFFYGEPEEAIKILTDEFHEEVRFIDEQWIDNGKDDNNEID